MVTPIRGLRTDPFCGLKLQEEQTSTLRIARNSLRDAHQSKCDKDLVVSRTLLPYDHLSGYPCPRQCLKSYLRFLSSCVSGSQPRYVRLRIIMVNVAEWSTVLWSLVSTRQAYIQAAPLYVTPTAICSHYSHCNNLLFAL